MIELDGIEYITAAEWAAETGHAVSTIHEARRRNLAGLGDAARRWVKLWHYPRPAIAAWRAYMEPRLRPRLATLAPGGERIQSHGGDRIGVYPVDALAIVYQRPGARRDGDDDHRWCLTGPDGVLSSWEVPEGALLAAQNHTRARPLRMRRDGADRFVLYAEGTG